MNNINNFSPIKDIYCNEESTNSHVKKDYIANMPGYSRLILPSNTEDKKSNMYQNSINLQHDFFASMSESLRQTEKKFTLNFLATLARNNEICCSIRNSEECLALLLDFLFENAELSGWPYEFYNNFRTNVRSRGSLMQIQRI
ncbi:hypothetical protein HZS_3095 [Henneguya salminicola]|nr:hypothetical protein HZS_3095 [Henneguya salminicola]